MRKLACIHTVKPVTLSFADNLKKVIGDDYIIYNIMDDFLLLDAGPDASGYITPNNKRRLLNDLVNAQNTGAEMIIVSCSTLSRTVEELRPLIDIPVVAIDDAMLEKAIQRGGKILVLATAASTIPATVQGLKNWAKKLNTTAEIDTATDAKAYEAMKNMDMETHDHIMIEKARSFKGYDTLVLAQASMAHLEKPIQEVTGICTLSSPELCYEKVAKMLKGSNK